MLWQNTCCRNKKESEIKNMIHSLQLIMAILLSVGTDDCILFFSKKPA